MQDVQHRKTYQHRYSEGELLGIAYDIIRALAYAEWNDVLHLDIQPSNIYYDGNTKSAKLGDFNSAIRLIECAGHAPAAYRMSNMIRREVFSLGLTLLTLASLEPGMMDLVAVKKYETTQLMLGNLPYSGCVKDLITDLLMFNCAMQQPFSQIERKYCLRAVHFSIQPFLSSSTLPVQSLEAAPLLQPQASSIPHSFNASHSMQLQAIVINQAKVHQDFQCCAERPQYALPVLLECSSGDLLHFCQMSCYAQFVEQTTNGYTKMNIKCPICEGIIGKKAIKKAFGPHFTQYMRRSYEKGLLCVNCKQRTATHVIECGHLHCNTCLDLYRTSLWQKITYICAACGLISRTRASKLKQEFSIFSSFFCSRSIESA